MPRPVVYLAFANDQDAHLSLLKEESRQLMQLLSSVHDKQAMEIYRDESTNVEDLIQCFHRFDGRIAIFHYGGHAEGSGLHLEGGAAHAGGLAEVLSQQKELQLVFLNGCSTQAQVDRLLKLGVKAVIATSVPVQDARARDFAGWFYQALAVKKNLKGAFEFAVAAMQTRYGGSLAPELTVCRGVAFQEDGRAGGALPWGLYVNETHQQVLDWRLPDAPIHRFLANPLANYSPNDYLPKILGAMVRHDPSLRQVIEDVKTGRKDKREVLPLIIQNLPWTIGAQLQKLISRSDSMRTPGPERLHQTINTYVIAARVLFYILASQLWEERRKAGKPLTGPPLAGLLSLDEKGTRFFDYIAALANTGEYFHPNGWRPFIGEFDQLFTSLQKKDYFYQSYLLLESIREQLNSGHLDPAAAPLLCEEAENSLTIFIGTISFLVNYKMVAVRDINVDSTRHRDVSYRHKLGSLNAADSAYLTLDSVPRSFLNHAESGSILLVDNLDTDKIDRFLSLSPFIIDNNAFLDKSQESLDIYLFSHVENGAYVYQNVNSHYQKMEEHKTYTVSTAYEERKEVKDEVDFGWEFNESSTRIVKPYAVLEEQFENLKSDLTGN